MASKYKLKDPLGFMGYKPKHGIRMHGLLGEFLMFTHQLRTQ